MRVVLKEEYKNDLFIQALNEELTNSYGSNTTGKFKTWQYLQEEADYINLHPEGLTQFPDWKRPVTKERLHLNFFWMRFGEFWLNLSDCLESDEARDAVAICKWLMKTKCRYIDKSKSDNYSPKVVKECLNYLFEEAGYDLAVLWKLP